MLTPSAILFDLDGTLADTAPDLAEALNVMRIKRGIAAAPYLSLRSFASAGARGLLHAGFGITPDSNEYEEMKQEFLSNYENALAEKSQLFEHIDTLLNGLDELGIQWGIVTNKATRFTTPLVPILGLAHAATVISGDTTEHAKPHPEPLLEAARRIDTSPKKCWYVGDDLRDIQAGSAAGMTTIAAAWGYCGAVEPSHWEADAILDSPLELLELIRAKLQQASASSSTPQP